MFVVIKYHKTEAGETSSMAKGETIEDALSIYYGFAKAYSDDKSVLAWGLSLEEIDSAGKFTVKKRDNYVKPIPVPPEPEENVQAEAG